MKKNRFYLIVGFLGFSFQAFTQDYSFKVLANKGSNQVKSGEVTQPIKTGAKLISTDEIIVADNAYIGLVHATGKPIELKKSGNYKVEDLIKKIGTGTSVLSKYTDFILSSNSAEAKKNRLSATGAVHRGLAEIKLLLPENKNRIYNDTVSINWETKTTGPFVVVLKSMFDEELFNTTVSDNNLRVSLNHPKLAKEGTFLVEIRSKSDSKSKSEQRVVKKLSAKELGETKASLAEIEKEFTENSSFKQLLMAGFYEQKGLLIDAIGCYEKAIKLSPDVPSYKEDYEEFLLRNRLKSVK
jgi:tetratricopeptide (TPR) repeat protein